MHVMHLSLRDFRSYSEVELALGPGVTTFLGPNGQGKTNLVEAVGYVATLASHRVAQDSPLVRLGAQRAIVRTVVARDGRQTLVELEITPGRANRARINRAPVPRPREVLGVLRTVFFAPEDLALVRGDPGERRRFLDDLLVARAPRLAAVRADYERVLKQRNALLKSAGGKLRATGGDVATLDVWDAHLARAGADLLGARLELIGDLEPHVHSAYDALSGGAGGTTLRYRSSLGEDVDLTPHRAALSAALLAAAQSVRRAELERGITLVGPHRDDVLFSLHSPSADVGELPARGYASHGEAWSLALSLRLAAYHLLRGDGGEPVLILDDVFAELDTARRARLAALVADAEQVLVTAAVEADVPDQLVGERIVVTRGEVRRAS